MCALQVGNFTGYRSSPNGPVYKIQLEGSADTCDRTVIVTFSEPVLDGSDQTQFPGIPIIDGHWMLVIEPASSSLSCGKRLTIDVQCSQDKDDPLKAVPRQLDCQVVACPEVRVIPEPSSEPCVNGMRKVTLAAEVTLAAPDTLAYWNFGDGQPPNENISIPFHIGQGSQICRVEHYYPVPGEYTAKFIIDAPPGCESYPVSISQLPQCEVVCPDIEGKFAGYRGDCNEFGQRIALLTAVVRNAQTGTQIGFDFQDGSPVDIIPIEPSDHVQYITRSHLYTAPGPARAKIVVIHPAGCDDIWITLAPFENCDHHSSDCDPVPASYELVVREANGSLVQPGNCVLGENIEVIAPEHQGPVEWELDGQPASPDIFLPRLLHVHLADHQPHTVKAFVGKDDCKVPKTATLVKCDRPKPPRPNYCVWLEAGTMISLVIGILSILVAFCALDAGVRFGAGQGAIGVGIIAFAFVVFQILASNWLTIMIIFLILAALWYFLCKPDFCRRLEDWVWCLLWASYLSGIAGTLIAMVCQDVALYVMIVGAFSFWSIHWLVQTNCKMPDPISLPWLRA